MAKNDVDAIQAWMNASASVSGTHRAYVNAMEKLVNWAWIVRRKAISSLDVDDFEAYGLFLLNPVPVHVWQSGVKRRKASGSWAPFVKALTPEAARHNLVIVNSLVNWLAHVGYARLRFVAGVRVQRPFGVRSDKKRHLAGPTLLLQPVLHQDDVHRVWEARLQSLERLQLEFLLQYLCALNASEVSRIMVADLRMPSRAPWMLSVPDRPPERRWVALLPPVQSAIAEHLRLHGLKKGNYLVESTESDVEKANKRIFERAADRCESNDEGEQAARRLKGLPGAALRYAFAEHSACLGVGVNAWQLIAARRSSFYGSRYEPERIQRPHMTQELFALHLQALSPVLQLLKRPSARG